MYTKIVLNAIFFISTIWCYIRMFCFIKLCKSSDSYVCITAKRSMLCFKMCDTPCNEKIIRVYVGYVSGY